MPEKPEPADHPEISWRLAAMRAQMPASERGPIPVLRAKADVPMESGRCLSCGGAVQPEIFGTVEKPRMAGRCDYCARAAYLAIQMGPAGTPTETFYD